MKTSLYVVILIAALALVPILSYAVMAQADAASNRTLCIQNCAWLRPQGRNYGQYQNYSNCMTRCESDFWKSIDRDTRELEKEVK